MPKLRKTGKKNRKTRNKKRQTRRKKYARKNRILINGGAGVKKIAYVVHESPSRPKHPVMIPVFYTEPYGTTGTMYQFENYLQDAFYSVEDNLIATKENMKGNKLPGKIFTYNMDTYSPLYSVQ